jgi:hypothetical protein
VHVIVGFPIEETNDVIAVGESFETVKFVLEDAAVEIAAHSDVKRPREAGHYVSAIVSGIAGHGGILGDPERGWL